MSGIKILGHGISQGDEKVTNFDLEKLVETSDEWIREKTGIESRFFARNKTNLDMAAEAGAEAIENSGIRASEIDLVLVCTLTPDYATPSVSCGVAKRLGIGQDAMCLDINAACSGFVYGLTVARSMLASGNAKCVLAIGSEKLSPLLNMKDRGTCVLFGDGAGALILKEDRGGEFYSISGNEYSDDVLYCDRFNPAITMKGQEVYRFAVNKVPETINAVMRLAGREVSEIDAFILHQANHRIIHSAAAKLKIPPGKIFENVQRYGNTSGASVAICMAEMLEKGLLERGMRAIACGFGAGLTYGSALFTVG